MYSTFFFGIHKLYDLSPKDLRHTMHVSRHFYIGVHYEYSYITCTDISYSTETISMNFRRVVFDRNWFNLGSMSRIIDTNRKQYFSLMILYGFTYNI